MPMDDSRRFVDPVSGNYSRPKPRYPDQTRLQMDFPMRNGRRYRRKRRRLAIRTRSRRLSQTAVLALCLITGLSLGVGSAFADEKLPSKRILEQPMFPEDAELDLTQKQDSEETSLNLPPKDLQDDTPSESELSSTDSQNQHSNSTYSAKVENDSTKNDEKELNKNDTKGVNNSPKNDQTKKALTISPDDLEQGKVSKEGKEKVENAEKVTGAVGTTAGGSQVAQADTDKKEDSSQTKIGSDSSDKESKEIPNKPTTENGGTMPNTAGHDLEGVIFGSLAALLGALYILLRGKRVNKN
jgi:hypothetical protein